MRRDHCECSYDTQKQQIDANRRCCWGCGLPFKGVYYDNLDDHVKAVRAAGGDAWDNLNVNQELAAMRGQPQGTEARVCDDITERQALGINKYGTSVSNNPLTQKQWLQHAYEEALDLAIYLKRAIEQMDR